MGRSVIVHLPAFEPQMIKAAQEPSVPAAPKIEIFTNPFSEVFISLDIRI